MCTAGHVVDVALRSTHSPVSRPHSAAKPLPPLISRLPPPPCSTAPRVFFCPDSPCPCLLPVLLSTSSVLTSYAAVRATHARTAGIVWFIGNRQSVIRNLQPSQQPRRLSPSCVFPQCSQQPLCNETEFPTALQINTPCVRCRSPRADQFAQSSKLVQVIGALVGSLIALTTYVARSAMLAHSKEGTGL